MRWYAHASIKNLDHKSAKINAAIWEKIDRHNFVFSYICGLFADLGPVNILQNNAILRCKHGLGGVLTY